MNRKNWSNVLTVVVRAALALVFLSGQNAWALQGQNGKDKSSSSTAPKSQQTQTKPSTSASAKAQPAEEAEEEGNAAENARGQEESERRGQNEGIKVHGHWTIEVRNPDGTLVTHREFENSLQPSGVTVLADVLNGGSVPGGWAIALDGVPTSPWLPVNASPLYISAVSVTSALILPSNFPLVVGLPDSNAFLNLVSNRTGNGQLVLSGSALATQSGSVSTVSTYLDTCGNVFSPTNCVNHTGGAAGFLFTQFTAVTLSSPVQVSAGQTVAATVTISFS